MPRRSLFDALADVTDPRSVDAGGGVQLSVLLNRALAVYSDGDVQVLSGPMRGGTDWLTVRYSAAAGWLAVSVAPAGDANRLKELEASGVLGRVGG